jgi:hypothetical protein
VIDRRSFLAALVAVAAAGASQAQQPAKLPRVGMLNFGTKGSNARETPSSGSD